MTILSLIDVARLPNLREYYIETQKKGFESEARLEVAHEPLTNQVVGPSTVCPGISRLTNR